jgi:hypothetical protein
MVAAHIPPHAYLTLCQCPFKKLERNMKKGNGMRKEERERRRKMLAEKQGGGEGGMA